MKKVLTDAAIRALKPGAARREIADAKVPGLYLVLQPSGSQSWALRYRQAGKACKLTLGGGSLSLAVARDMARAALAKVATGANPAADKIEARREAKAVARPDRGSIESVASTFIARYAKVKTRERSWRETERLLQCEIVKPWQGRKLADIRKADFIERLDAIVDRGAPITANRTLAAFRRLCGWAVERGIIGASPCAAVRAPAPEQSRDRVLSPNELQAFWRACGAVGWPFGPLAKVLLLTGQRRSEVGELRWAEIDSTTKIWTIPKERAKNGLAHEVKLSNDVQAILDGLPRIEGGFVFTTTGKTPVSGFSKAKRQLDAAIKADIGKDCARWTFHDLRRTAASGMAELGIAPHVVEAALNHKSGTIKGVAAVYNRFQYGPERAQALDAWARRLAEIVTGEAAGNVIDLAKARG